MSPPGPPSPLLLLRPPPSLPSSSPLPLHDTMAVKLVRSAFDTPRAMVDTVLDGLYTGYLFSKSDIVPILGPAVCPRKQRDMHGPLIDVFAQLSMSMVLAGPTDLVAFLEGFAWTELHLMAFEVRLSSRVRCSADR